jgi:tRNA pseudouridine55 synthase
VETAGLDAEGEVIATSDVRPNVGDIEALLPKFTGKIEQIPPAYSAIKVDGKRAYDLARAGEEIELKPRSVTIYSLSGLAALRDNIGALSRKDAKNLDEMTLSAHVSKGTYIRSLARDIAHAVGTVGHVTMLRRTKAGPFTLDQAISLDKLNEIGKGAPQQDIILPLEAGLVDIPALDLSPEAAMAIRQGRVLTGIATNDGHYWGRGPDNRPVALLEQIDGQLRSLRGFNL